MLRKSLTRLSGRWTVLILWLIPCELTNSFEPMGITELKASSDGESLAVASYPARVGVLDFSTGGAMPIFTNELGKGFNWSQDGKALLFVERIPGEAPQVLEGRKSGDAPLEVLVGGEDWKADPAWLKPGQLIYRSDAFSDQIRVVALDAGTTTVTALVEGAGDVAALWPSPLGGEFFYAVAEARGYSLYWRGAAQGEVVKLHGENTFGVPTSSEVAISPDGTRVAYLRNAGIETEVVIYDLDLRTERATLPVASRPRAMTMTESGVVLEVNGALIEWEPNRRWSRDRARPVNWNGIELTHPVRLSGRGIAAVIGGDLIVTARDVDALPAGKIHTSRIEDLLDLSIRLQAGGQSREAVRLMDQLWAEYQETPQTNLLVASTRAVMETIDLRSRPMDEWLERTIQLSGPEGSEFASAWHARLLKSWFEDEDAKKTRELLRVLPERVTQYPLVDWVRDSMSLTDENTFKLWRSVVRGISRNQWSDVAESLLKLVMMDAQSDFTRRGVALLVRGEFEPLADMMLADQLSYPELMQEAEFQQAMVRLAGADLSSDLSKGDFRGMLLLQWAKSEEFEAARNLVMVDLSDPSGSSLDYVDILSRYLIAEEQDEWVSRAVDEIFLSKKISYMLQRNMNVTSSHLTFSLARAKNALIKRDMKALDERLTQLDNDLLIIPADYWTSNNAYHLYLIRLYRAKRHEADGKWSDALNSYSQAAQVIDRFPSNWEVSPLDLGMAKALLETEKTTASKQLEQFLAAFVTLGDPLISPTHETSGIEKALNELIALEKSPASESLIPFVLYGKGLCLQFLGRPYEAIVNFRKVRELNPPPRLLSRTLFEEAAARSVLTQSGLAAELLARFCSMPLPPAHLVTGIKSLTQAEQDAGRIASQEERIRYLCRQYEIPWFWTATLVDAPPPEPENPPSEPQG